MISKSITFKASNKFKGSWELTRNCFLLILLETNGLITYNLWHAKMCIHLLTCQILTLLRKKYFTCNRKLWKKQTAILLNMITNSHQSMDTLEFSLFSQYCVQKVNYLQSGLIPWIQWWKRVYIWLNTSLISDHWRGKIYLHAANQWTKLRH